MRTLSKITLVLGISLVLATGCSSDDSSDDATNLVWLAALSQVLPSSCSTANFLASGLTGSAQTLTFALTPGTGGTTSNDAIYVAFVPAAALTGANTVRLGSTTTVMNTSAPIVTVGAFNGSSCADVVASNQSLSALNTCTNAGANQKNCTVNTAGSYVLSISVSRGSGAALTSPPTDITVQKL